MSEEGYSTVMDAVLFLALVGACAVILGPAIAGHTVERSMADRGLRELAADVLCSLEWERVDYFEYRILGDVADAIAGYGEVNATEDVLYRDVTRALLGRGSRHMTAMDIAAGDAACQFSIRLGNAAVRMNPVTVEYDRAASTLIDRSVRAQLDPRFRYEFTLRWTPIAGVPLEGGARAGEPHPGGAASSSMRVTMPYTTNVTRASLELLNAPDLERLDRSIAEYRAGGDRARFRQGIRQAIEGCARNTTGLISGEIWNNTMGSFAARDLRLDPVMSLERFAGNKSLDVQALTGLNFSWEGVLEGLAVVCWGGEIERLAGEIEGEIDDGRVDAGKARGCVLDWLASRYEPSSAIATVTVWTGAYA